MTSVLEAITRDQPKIRPLPEGGLLRFHRVLFLLFLFIQSHCGPLVHWRHRRGRQNFCLHKSRMPLAGLVYFPFFSDIDLCTRSLTTMSKRPYDLLKCDAARLAISRGNTTLNAKQISKYLHKPSLKHH